ncbi:hypothetical protein QYE76_021973 [Lolium multiflorum]|uniref:Plantacyanin n=1 Tax=Lolium multiflorum TaxID=4521 RepID=A0AAD8R8W9_LOLMU|nr:hypothetical protein QYE76_021973 [Lolium multiflorum]
MARPIIGSLSSIVLVLILAWSIGTIAVRGYNTRKWTVGGDKGWSFGVAGWENDKPIQAGDMLVFKYKPGAHNVVEVNVAGYMECKAPDGAKVYSTGNDSFEMPGGKAYYICSIPGHCEKGMRIGIPPR